jgi:predicted DNA-binding protein with PD1-like motif
MRTTETEDRYVIVLERGENVKEQLRQFAETHNLCGYFYGLGAVHNPTVAYYSMADKDYHPQKLDGDYELLNMSGNIAMNNDDRVVHAHATMAGTDYNSIGGHLVEATVAVTVEVMFFPTKYMERKMDDETGLPLLHP